ncbi:unnamed protein product [Linum tenue]|uniref:S-protein homolog n=2 Tax=Linum tenue TaxID=586396 RepID=A0AAV0Q1U7_9ROSI|nr:unnamed protein product [Linum tenue]
MVMAILIMGPSPTTAEEGQTLTDKTTVQITNGLKVQLTAHCKSKDDDIGEKSLAFDDSFGWTFYPNYIPNTLFFCSFEWDGSGGKKYFDIYDEKRDEQRCTDCKWAIFHNGPCFYDEKAKLYDDCYPFNDS